MAGHGQPHFRRRHLVAVVRITPLKKPIASLIVFAELDAPNSRYGGIEPYPAREPVLKGPTFPDGSNTVARLTIRRCGSAVALDFKRQHQVGMAGDAFFLANKSLYMGFEINLPRQVSDGIGTRLKRGE
jgi:hypothetical protein